MWPFSVIANRRKEREAMVVRLLHDCGELSGYEIGRRCGMGAGALYPALMRLERASTITSRWGVATAERGWRRPRLYRLA